MVAVLEKDEDNAFCRQDLGAISQHLCGVCLPFCS
jgi:hypothetical protein